MNSALRCADPRITDYDTLLQNIRDLKEGRPTEVRRRGRQAAAGLLRSAWERMLPSLASLPARPRSSTTPVAMRAAPLSACCARCAAGADLRLQGEPAHGHARGGGARVAGGHPGGDLRAVAAHTVRAACTLRCAALRRGSALGAVVNCPAGAWAPMHCSRSLQLPLMNSALPARSPAAPCWTCA